MDGPINWVGQNTKLDGPVPCRPTHSAATATTSITVPIINNIISSDPNSFVIYSNIIVSLSLKKQCNFNYNNAFPITKNNANQMN